MSQPRIEIWVVHVEYLRSVHVWYRTRLVRRTLVWGRGRRCRCWCVIVRFIHFVRYRRTCTVHRRSWDFILSVRIVYEDHIGNCFECSSPPNCRKAHVCRWINITTHHATWWMFWDDPRTLEIKRPYIFHECTIPVFDSQYFCRGVWDDYVLVLFLVHGRSAVDMSVSFCSEPAEATRAENPLPLLLSLFCISFHLLCIASLCHNATSLDHSDWLFALSLSLVVSAGVHWSHGGRFITFPAIYVTAFSQYLVSV